MCLYPVFVSKGLAELEFSPSSHLESLGFTGGFKVSGGHDSEGVTPWEVLR